MDGGIDNEHNRMVSHEVCIEVDKRDVPEGKQKLNTTYKMKDKANVKLRARMNSRGYEQKPGS